MTPLRRSRDMASTTEAVGVCSGTDGVSRASHRGTLGIIALLLGVSCKGVEDLPRSEMLASEPVIGGGEAHAIATGLIFSLDISSVVPACREQGVAIFYQTIIRNGDDHKTLVADAGNEPDFATFTHLLTDGVDEEVTACTFIENGGGGATGGGEPLFFKVKLERGRDCPGSTVDRVDVQRDSVLTG